MDDVRVPDLAREAGVSVATVSRVLGGRERVTARTSAKVHAAVERLGYSRSTLLPRSAAPLIRVLLPESPGSWQLETAHAVIALVADAGGLPVLGTGPSGGSAAHSAAGPAGPAGGVVAIRLGLEETRPTAQGGIVQLAVGDQPVGGRLSGDAAPATAPTGRVGISIGPGLNAALDHLAALGHRRIGLIRPGGRWGDACEQAFRAGHPSTHLSAAEISRWITTVDDAETASARGMSRLLDSTCTAIICATDRQLIGALTGAGSFKFAVPRDVSVIGIGDDPRMPFTYPAATVVRVDVDVAAKRLTDAALAMDAAASPVGTAGPASTAGTAGTAGPASTAGTACTAGEVPCDLVVRASTGPVRGRR